MQPARHTCPDSCLTRHFHWIHLLHKCKVEYWHVIVFLFNGLQLQQRFCPDYENRAAAFVEAAEAPNKSRLFGFSVRNQISVALEWRRCVSCESYLHCECVSQLYQVYCRPLAPRLPSPPSVRNATQKCILSQRLFPFAGARRVIVFLGSF
jgi:hypothetical protein